MNRKSLTGLVLSAYMGITGCSTIEQTKAIGTVKYGFCNQQRDTYKLKLTEAEIYLNDESRTNVELTGKHTQCNLFQRIPEGTEVKVVGEWRYPNAVDDPNDGGLWSYETYRLDTGELIYPVERNE